MAGELRVAVVGVGRWGERQLRAFAATPGVRLVALADPRQAHLAHLAPGLRCFADAEELFAAQIASAVVIATPTPTHAPLALAALRSGHHVLVEKPLALDVAAAEAIGALATSQARVAMVGHLLEHHPKLIQIEAHLARADLGTLGRIESRRHATRMTRDDPWWTLAPHDLSLAIRLAGPPRELRYIGKCGGCEVFELDHAGAVVTRIEVGFGRPSKVRELRVVGAHAAAVLDDTAPPQAPSPLERQAAAFVAAVARGTAPERGSLALGIEVVRWLTRGAQARERARRGAA